MYFPQHRSDQLNTLQSYSPPDSYDTREVKQKFHFLIKVTITMFIIIIAGGSALLITSSKKVAKIKYPLASITLNPYTSSASVGFIPLDSIDSDHLGPFIPTIHPTISRNPQTSKKTRNAKPTRSSRVRSTPHQSTTTSVTSVRPSTTSSPHLRSSATPSSTTPAHTTISTISSTNPHGKGISGKATSGATGISTTTNSQPFTYEEFNPCTFTVSDFVRFGLPPLPYRNKTIINDWTDGASVDDECTYTSDLNNNPHWQISIEKVSFYGVPAEFDWLPLGHYTDTAHETVDARKIRINGHTAILEEISYYRGTGCKIGIIPGSWFFLTDHSGNSSPSATCTMLIRFVSQIVH